MTGVRRLEHVHLGVTDRAEATEFYTDVMGMATIESADGVEYLGCGRDHHYDLAVSEGQTGVRRFGIRVGNHEQLDSFEQRLHESGIDTSRENRQHRSRKETVRFDLPSGVSMELVAVAADRYQRTGETALDARAGIAPIDVDHITLRSDSVEEDVDFLKDVLGFTVSDIVKDESGDLRGVWTRFGDYHHDIAFITTGNPTETLDHLAWLMSDVGHMKGFLDHLADNGYRIEVGLNKHFVGSNLFAYFWEPGGNRFELSAEMATLEDTVDPVVHGPEVDTFSAWGGIEYPETFSDGS